MLPLRNDFDMLILFPVEIQTSDYLPLMSPIRGMSMTFECLIEVDIRIKGDIEDVTLVDGCSDLIESHCLYDTEIECTMDDTNGAAIFDFIIFRRALEATINLNFTKVPTGGMEVKMCGYTAISKGLYYFMGEQCEWSVHYLCWETSTILHSSCAV